MLWHPGLPQLTQTSWKSLHLTKEPQLLKCRLRGALISALLSCNTGIPLLQRHEDTSMTWRSTPVHCRVGEVQGGAAVVLDDPGEHGVLRQILETAAGLAVEEHEVLEVGDAAALPVARPAPPAARALQLRRRLPLYQACVPRNLCIDDMQRCSSNELGSSACCSLRTPVQVRVVIILC